MIAHVSAAGTLLHLTETERAKGSEPVHVRAGPAVEALPMARARRIICSPLLVEELRLTVAGGEECSRWMRGGTRPRGRCGGTSTPTSLKAKRGMVGALLARAEAQVAPAVRGRMPC